MRRVASIAMVLAGLAAAAPSLPQAPPEETLVSITQGTNLAVALSPDGETLAVDLLGSIWVVPVEGGEATRVTDATSDARQPAWSPDGERIAFQAYREGNWHIWSVRPDGTRLERHTSGVFAHREPDWATGGDRIVMSSDRGGDYDVWELDLGSGGMTRLTDGPGAEFGPAYGPDGGLAWASTADEGGSITVREADGDERVVATVAGSVAGPSFSPDGERLVFNEIRDGRSDLWVVESDDDDQEVRSATAAGQDVFPFRVAWTSEAEFLYTADGEIKRQRLDEDREEPVGAPEVVGFDAAVRIHRPAYERRVRDFDGTGARPALGIVSPVVAPGADAVAFVALGDLWTLPLGGAGEPSDGVPTNLTSDAAVELDPAFSPDGSTLAYSSDRAGSFDIWLREVATGEERRLTEAPGSETKAAFSPDGSTVAFIDQEGRVMAVEVVSGEVTTLHAALHMPGRPTWAPDGRTVAVAALTPYSGRFREGRNEFLKVSLEGEEDRRVTPMPHRSPGTREYDGPVWSPDGRRMAFTAGSTLWVVDVDAEGNPGGEPRRLTDGIADSPSWTGDSASLVYLDNGALERVFLDDGRIEEIPLDLTWSRALPDARRLVHAGRLFDGRTDELRADVDVVIDGHRIASVEPHDAARHAEVVEASGEDAVVDASGLTVMPGLIEMHAHQESDMNRTWLAWGITTVREPVAHAYRALERREAIAAGVRPGPREFFAGESFDGSRVYYSGSMSVEALDEIELQLERADVLGWDLIKTYVRLPDRLQYAVVNGAHEIGIPVTSHEIYPAVAYGADGVEHLRGTSRRGYSPKVSELNRSYQDVVALLTRSDMTITPTIGIYGGFPLVLARDDGLLADPRVRALFSAAVVEELEGQAAELRADEARRALIAEGLVAPYGDTLRRVVDGGGRVVAGTDAPIDPPGIGYHAELELLVAGGLTPFEALRAGTSWAADALDASEHLGTVEPGRLADLIVVDGDPLTDIRAARELRVVIKNGEVHRLEDLLGSGGEGPS